MNIMLHYSVSQKMTGYHYPGGLTLRTDYCFYMILFPSTMKNTALECWLV